MSEISKLFEHLKRVIAHPLFLSRDLARGETPFYICPYEAADDAGMQTLIGQLMEQLDTQSIPVLKIDLFNLCIEILRENDDLDWFCEHEGELSKDDLLDQLCNVLDVDQIADEIRRRVDASPHRVLFLTGIGNCYPFLRAHNLLENLASVVTQTPLVMFFPGEYRQIDGVGATLSLQGRAHSDGYYRAYDIRTCTV